jgi:competence protein ComEC
VRYAPAPQRPDDAAAHPMESLRQSVRDASRTSSSEAFIDAARPQIALVQAGYRNRYGHPVAEVLQRYRDRGIALRLSPSCGAWTRMAAGPAGGECERDSSRRYWHHTGALDPP